jgi:hypothetical protein
MKNQLRNYSLFGLNERNLGVHNLEKEFRRRCWIQLGFWLPSRRTHQLPVFKRDGNDEVWSQFVFSNVRLVELAVCDGFFLSAG